MQRMAVMMAVVLGATVPGAGAFAQVIGETEERGPVHRAKGDIDGDGRSNILMLHVRLDHHDHLPCPADPDVGPAPHVHRSTHTDWGMASLVADEGQTLGPGPWQVSATGDFDGDGNPDLFWQRLVDDEGTGFASRGRIESLAVTLTPAADPHHYAGPPTDTIAPPEGPWTQIGAGDFGGVDAGDAAHLAPPDGRDDVLWRNDETGALSVWISDGGAFPEQYRHALINTEATAVPQVVADLDGDGTAEIVARDSVTDRLTYWKMHGTSHQTVYLDPDHVADTNWQLVGAGDFDGDGRDDLLWRNDDQWKLVVWFMRNGQRSAGGFVTKAGSPEYFSLLGADLAQAECHRWVIAGPR